jgi:hypothetical protein
MKAEKELSRFLCVFFSQFSSAPFFVRWVKNECKFKETTATFVNQEQKCCFRRQPWKRKSFMKLIFGKSPLLVGSRAIMKIWRAAKPSFRLFALLEKFPAKDVVCEPAEFGTCKLLFSLSSSLVYDSGRDFKLFLVSSSSRGILLNRNYERLIFFKHKFAGCKRGLLLISIFFASSVALSTMRAKIPYS